MKNFKIIQSFWAIGIFVFLNLIAMYLYPGGTILDSSKNGYLFFYNFFSNLGEWIAQNGEDNFYSASLFNSSLLILSISYMLFYTAYYPFFLEEKKSRFLIKISFFLIVLSLVSFVLVAIFSAEDSTFDMHVFFVKVAFRSLMLYSIFQTLAVYYNSASSKTMIFSNILFTIILFLFIIIMEFGPNPFENNESLFIQVISQKIIVFSILLYYFIQSKEILILRK